MSAGERVSLVSIRNIALKILEEYCDGRDYIDQIRFEEENDPELGAFPRLVFPTAALNLTRDQTEKFIDFVNGLMEKFDIENLTIWRHVAGEPNEIYLGEGVIESRVDEFDSPHEVETPTGPIARKERSGTNDTEEEGGEGSFFIIDAEDDEAAASGGGVAGEDSEDESGTEEDREKEDDEEEGDSDEEAGNGGPSEEPAEEVVEEDFDWGPRGIPVPGVIHPDDWEVHLANLARPPEVTLRVTADSFHNLKIPGIDSTPFMLGGASGFGEGGHTG
ncbi:MAG: hypothetical protein RLN62_05525 [Rickettsiales bacterium]